MSSEPRDDQIWYRLGYTLQRIVQTASPGGDPGQAAARIPSTPASNRGSLNPFLEVGAGWLERQLAVRVQRWVGRRARTPWMGALLGAAIELGTQAVVGMVRAEKRVRRGDEDADSWERSPYDPELPAHLPPRPRSLIPDPLGTAARGAAHGLIYGGLVSSLPAPAVAKGAMYGVARYVAAEGGGLAHLLGPVSPHRAVPLLDTMVAQEDPDESIFAYVAMGVALATIYESSPASSGTTLGSEDLGGEELVGD